MDTRISSEILSKVHQVEIKTNRLVDETLAGRYHSVFKGRGMNFDEVREYVPGDDVRAIDWNVTARTGRPHVKKFTEERELTIMLIIDVSASGEFGSATWSKREMMAELGSVLAFSAVRNNDKVGLILFTDGAELYIPPKKGRTHILRVIREILFFQPDGTRTDLTAAMDFANQVIRRRAVAFLISDFCLPGEFKDSLQALKPKLQITGRHHDLIAVSINDPRERELPDIGILTVEDAETGEQVELDTSRAEIRNRFTSLADERRGELRRTIRSSGVDLLELSTDRAYLPELLNFFGSRERRRH
ncbi:MAG: DUF58 domain-containing protein [Deltaproteobacteria bacterium]|nr:DUF58 domain-containing protein [Deltaproteobacteria bacterium]MBW2047706.1 DUF58 domain-containing protein [Deltaproteobacteria bacterium]MBW2112637.1 DUF58 domain-containing protein [Deltaproteobacteria bacterium]MBW2353214.1 DUF58 domain-containing protein [Deltaproteobacteria bacterium]